MTQCDLFESFAINLARASDAATTALTRRLALYDITAVQWGIVAALHEKEGVTPTELMAELERDLPSTLRLLYKLEKKGILRRECNPLDRRSQIVYLTPEGHALWERLSPIVLQLNTEAYGEMDPSCLELMMTTVRSLRANYGAMLKA